MGKWIISPFLAASLLLVFGCSGKKTTEQIEKIVPVKTLQIKYSTNANEENYVGTADGDISLSLSFLLGGTVEQVFASEGQKVKKGQLLAVLNSGTQQNAYEIAQSTLKRAQDGYNRISELHGKGSATDIQFVEVETSLEQAKAMASVAKKTLEDCKLYSPMNGVIANRDIEAGSNVMMGGPAFKIVSVDNIEVKTSVSENEIPNIKIGQIARIVIPALGNKEYVGTVSTKGIEANAISRTYEVKVKIKNSQSEIMPGMVCKVFIHQESDDKQIIIPNKAVSIASDGERFVWVNENNVAKRRLVTIGLLTENGVSIVSGLAEGDNVIVEGYSKISEGMKISVTQ